MTQPSTYERMNERQFIAQYSSQGGKKHSKTKIQKNRSLANLKSAIHESNKP
jgi:hypothetical protein